MLPFVDWTETFLSLGDPSLSSNSLCTYTYAYFHGYAYIEEKMLFRTSEIKSDSSLFFISLCHAGYTYVYAYVDAYISIMHISRVRE